MLLITRRTDESIVINDTIIVKVVEVRGNRVKLGFDFPEGNTVYREELFTKIQAENKAAALNGASSAASITPDTMKANLLKALHRPQAPHSTKEENHANITPHAGDADE